MAKKKSIQMHESYRTKDDWIQDALIILYNSCESYEPGKGAFNNFARFMVSRRLISIQRDLYRKNPPVNDDLRKVFLSLKREKGRKPTAEELMEVTGLSREQIEKFMDSGFGERMFTRAKDDVLEKHVKTGMSPEEQYIRLEARKILGDCIEKLEPEIKLLFKLHEYENISFQKLFDDVKFRNILLKKAGSLKTFQRRYEEDVYSPVRHCVDVHYK